MGIRVIEQLRVALCRGVLFAGLRGRRRHRRATNPQERATSAANAIRCLSGRPTRAGGARLWQCRLVVRGSAESRSALARTDQPHLRHGGAGRPLRRGASTRRPGAQARQLRRGRRPRSADRSGQGGRHRRPRSPAQKPCRTMGCTAMSARWPAPGRRWRWATSSVPMRPAGPRQIQRLRPAQIFPTWPAL